jgi:hypothetical protein
MNISEDEIPNDIPHELSKEEITKKLANGIREHLKKYKTYTFRPAKIDGIYCYAVIHRKKKIVNFESINVICHISVRNKTKKTQKYSLLYKKYKTIENALEIVENVASTYKIYNGDLVNPNDYLLLRLEENLIPYEEHQKCCVCLENTQETTICNHYICFHCRDKCIATESTDCPICRKPGIMRIFNIDNHMINNSEYTILSEAIDYEYTTESSSESENSEEEHEETPQEEIPTEIYQINHMYRFPLFMTPSIFASPSTESLDDIFTFPFVAD